jgi:hypothetical protein
MKQTLYLQKSFIEALRKSLKAEQKWPGDEEFFEMPS